MIKNWRLLFFPGFLALTLLLLPGMTLAAGSEYNKLAPWEWQTSADGLTTTTPYHVHQFMASTTGWSNPFFFTIDALSYPLIGAPIAVMVIGLIVGVIIKVVKGATRGGRRGRRRRR